MSKERDISLLREMAASITFQIKFIKFGSRERRNDFTFMLRAVTDQFTTIMLIYKSEGRKK